MSAVPPELDLPVTSTLADTVGAFPPMPNPTLDERPADAKLATLVPRADDLQYVRTLGEGGMGRVVLARQPSLHRSVAVKTTADRERHDALVAEAVITGMLEHPNIPPVHQLGEDEHGNPVLVMKRIEGAAWSELLADPEHPLRKDNPLFAGGELEAHLEILVQVCNALHFAHTRGVVHRDVKPANVMIGTFGEVMLIDWGVAFAREVPGIVSAQDIVGTPGYMAPEMLRGEEPEPRTDVYLLGSTLHEVLTGRRRHVASKVADAFASIARSSPMEYDASVPSALGALANQATSVSIADRPASAQEFAQALRGFLRHRTAVEIADRAAEDFRELEALARGPDDEDRFTRLTMRCRFALHESLRAWPDNARAQALQLDLSRLLLQHALERRDLPSARAAAAELRGADALDCELADALTELETAERERAAHERERDLEAGRRQREGLFALIVVSIVPLQIYRSFMRPWSEVTPGEQHLELFLVGALLLLPVALLAALLRRRVARTAAGRRVLELYWLLCAAMLAHRGLAVVTEPGLAAVIGADFLLGAVVFATGARSLGRPFFAPALVFVPGAVLVTAYPEYLSVLTNGTAALAVFALVWAQRRSAREQRSTKPSRVRP